MYVFSKPLKVAGVTPEVSKSVHMYKIMRGVRVTSANQQYKKNMALAGAKPMGLCFAPTSTKIRTPISAVKTLKNNVLIGLYF